MTAGAFGYGNRNRVPDDKDRIPEDVAVHLGKVALTSSIIMGKTLYDGDPQESGSTLQDKLEMLEAGVRVTGEIVGGVKNIWNQMPHRDYVHEDGAPLKVPGVEKDTSGKGEHPYVRAKRLAATGPVGQSQTKLRKSIGGNASGVIGASALVAAGEQRAMPLKMKLGKQMVAKDSVRKLL